MTDVRASKIEAAAVLLVRALDQGTPARIQQALDQLRAALTQPVRVA